MKSFKVVAETDESITYQYNTYYSWILIGLLVFFAAGISSNVIFLEVASEVVIVIYFGIRFITGRKVMRDVKQALKSGTVEVSGRKYSFSRPLTLKVPKNCLTKVSN